MEWYVEKLDSSLTIDEVLKRYAKEHLVNNFESFIEKYCINEMLEDDDGESDIIYCYEDGACGYKVLFIIVDEKDEGKS